MSGVCYIVSNDLTIKRSNDEVIWHTVAYL